MWLTTRLVPDHKTIADFRKDNGAAIRKVCSQFVALYPLSNGDVCMTRPEERLQALGLELPNPVMVPDGLHLPFSFVNVRGDRAVFSGHPKQAPDGAIAGPYGVLGADLTTKEGYSAAQGVALSVLANLKAEIGELSRVTGWVRVFGMVTSAPGYSEQHLVVNGFSDLIKDVFGPDVGRHARSAIGVAGLPMGFAMEIEGEVLIAS
jgi:enamine deaminase RidA (YjgF/YER057c/UK114 family)